MPSSTTSDTVAALRRFIAQGSHQPGARLPSERLLAETIGASRPTVREAIRHLVEAGVLEARRGSGTYVCAFDLEEVFAVRLRLEPFAARLAAEQVDGAAGSELRRLLSQLAARAGDPEGFAEADHAIHRAVARISGNRILRMTLERLTDLTALSRSVTSQRIPAGQTLEQMRSLVDAIAARDAAGAETAMRTHLEQVRSAIDP
jgi:GntR family transcriptional repressor for pyruvate dehydrogenase complex